MAPTPNEKDLYQDAAAVTNAQNAMQTEVVDAIRRTARALEADVSASEAQWKGDAHNAFVNFHNQLNASIVKLNGRLDKLTETMGDSTKKVTAQEAAAQSGFTNLHVNV
ncbi:WXG100 family type VII secretion target [Nocardia asiatica]|uniref:WXG100 family type VII secretion target n=1 Tax=Nocardia asiatica TaxID=209252 RepID=UPI00245838DE|nr:WXG100 family type VII secretion target [Nocardia asiatica]